jgi:hypothetical protein
VCLRFSVLCCPVLVQALRWADSPSKESYQMSKEGHKFQKISSEPVQNKRPNPRKTTMMMMMEHVLCVLSDTSKKQNEYSFPN